jgi:hypothetical protein
LFRSISFWAVELNEASTVERGTVPYSIDNIIYRRKYILANVGVQFWLVQDSGASGPGSQDAFPIDISISRKNYDTYFETERICVKNCWCGTFQVQQKLLALVQLHFLKIHSVEIGNKKVILEFHVFSEFGGVLIFKNACFMICWESFMLSDHSPLKSYLMHKT